MISIQDSPHNEIEENMVILQRIEEIMKTRSKQEKGEKEKKIMTDTEY